MIANYFLSNLQKLMDSNNMNQVQLASLIGISQATVSAWFTRKTIPGSGTIEKLGEIFKIEPYYFFMKPGTQDNMNAPASSDAFKLLLDDLAVKCLSPVELNTYKREGVDEFIRILRINYESPQHILPVGWVMKLSEELTKYTSINLMEKLKVIMAEQDSKKAKSS